MAALSVQQLGANGGAVTLAAASGGGDTVTGGVRQGGWGLGVVAVVAVGATATVVSVNGTALPSATSQTLLIPCMSGYNQAGTTALTYSQVTGVTVGAARLADAV